ncbi:MAG TPA: TIGR03013 family XrtA/PEP-CTERM system glycosyltransferase [Candidatus Sulfotelmatobacter sp.]|nr:TIGR03013 family XrtA/PEP-CTERM system glycosyltransferase [Candidatus Sulfotelmatobacter sp.]
MIRLFKVYYPLRTLVLLAGEAMIVWVSFVLGTMLRTQDSWLVLNVEGGYLKILVVTVAVLLFSHWLDLYDSSSLSKHWEQSLRILLVLGFVALALSAIGFLFPQFLPGNGSALLGLIILSCTLFCWRGAYGWMVKQPILRERVYVLGTGDRAERLVQGLRERSTMGIEVVGWTGDVEGELTRESVATHLIASSRGRGFHRVIVAMPDRRGTLPVEELLDLRLRGLRVEEATSWLEKMSGRIEVEQLYPSWLIFAEGFRFSNSFRLVRRLLNLLLALVALVVSLPLLPFIVLAVKLGSPGPALYRQKRVGRRGQVFFCYKFRTMRQDAEADTGATWATDDDPRITRVGKFLRSSRLDEIPQLWCVLKGDMHFVGPRPERPEFVEWLSEKIPYYGVRHMVRPGITGWAQVQYKYGNTLDDAREKLQYDLFYIKNASFGLDMLIMFQTIKIVLLGRGAK